MFGSVTIQKEHNDIQEVPDISKRDIHIPVTTEKSRNNNPSHQRNQFQKPLYVWFGRSLHALEVCCIQDLIHMVVVGVFESTEFWAVVDGHAVVLGLHGVSLELFVHAHLSHVVAKSGVDFLHLRIGEENSIRFRYMGFSFSI